MVATSSTEDVSEIHLCQGCFGEFGSEWERELPAAIQAGCKYCGGEFYSGGFDSLAGLKGVRKVRIMCRPCAEEYYRFLRMKLPGFGDPDLSADQMANLVDKIKTGDFPAILVELDGHMKQWVAKRKSQ